MDILKKILDNKKEEVALLKNSFPINQIKEGIESVVSTISFEVGETVKVADGPFASFTGIVEEVGKIHSIKGEEISIKCKKILEGSKIGDSISVSGVCLTITVITEDSLNFQISEETRAKTIFGTEDNQSFVNLERAATYESRIGGHNVEGLSLIHI